MDTTFSDMGVIRSIESRYTYATKLQNSTAYNFEISEQLRYYIGMKNRIRRGKSASNLNGMYIGVLGSYKVENQRLSRFDSNGFPAYFDYSTKYLNWGLGIGYQLQTNRRSFLDISTNFLRENSTFPFEYSSSSSRTITNSLINFSLKLGFAR
jgi:hypothetical protein